MVRKKIWNIPPTAHEVIQDIALRPGHTPYAISQRLNKTTSTIYKAIKDLEKNSLVMGAIDEKWTRGQDRKEFAINLNGFCYCIANTSLKVAEICRANPSLIPLITDKWQLFNQEDIADIAIKKLIAASLSHSFNRKIPLPKPSEYGYSDTDEHHFAHVFFHPFYFDYQNERLSKEEIDLWVRTCSKDDEIKTFINNMLVKTVDHYHKSLALVESVLGIL